MFNIRQVRTREHTCFIERNITTSTRLTHHFARNLKILIVFDMEKLVKGMQISYKITCRCWAVVFYGKVKRYLTHIHVHARFQHSISCTHTKAITNDDRWIIKYGHDHYHHPRWVMSTSSHFCTCKNMKKTSVLLHQKIPFLDISEWENYAKFSEMTCFDKQRLV